MGVMYEGLGLGMELGFALRSAAFTALGVEMQTAFQRRNTALKVTLEKSCWGKIKINPFVPGFEQGTAFLSSSGYRHSILLRALWTGYSCLPAAEGTRAGFQADSARS